MIELFSFKGRNIKVLLVLIFIFIHIISSGQSVQFNYFYRIYFRDKGDNDPSHYVASSLLSGRAIDRRTRAGIPLPDIGDIPVYKDYLSGISALGLTLHCTSKWMNTGLFKTAQPIDMSILRDLPYVADVRLVKNPVSKSGFRDKLEFPVYQADPSDYDRPVTMLNGSLLHSSGFDGKGVLIAVLDGGFYNANIITSLSHLRDRNGIIATYDFVNNDTYVYDYHNHGTAVLSVLAGSIDGMIEGTAPGADYLLLRTEDAGSEFSVEEDFWAAGAEYADSAGADIISTSLGYFNFDDHSLDYQYTDFNGDRAFVTCAADIAASKGILVVASAGNERNKTWKRILAPSDGDSVISVGAVDGENVISAFSSAGPSADGRIKPDNVAMGVDVPVQTEISITARSSGTSFSCPVLSGMTACLIQAVPGVVNTDIINALHYSADRYNAPDSLYGYGVPDMMKALEWLQNLRVKKPENGSFAWPNPTAGEVKIIFREPPGSIKVEIFNSEGILFFKEQFREFAGRTLIIHELQNKKEGLYFIRVITDSSTFTHKIIKISS
jgi:serine protease AprX